MSRMGQPKFGMTLGVGELSFSVSGVDSSLDKELCELLYAFMDGLRPLVQETRLLNDCRQGLVEAGYAPKLRRVK